MHQTWVDVCKSWSKQARYPQNIAFAPRRFGTPLGVTKHFRVFTLRRFHTALLPARRFTHALFVTCRTFGFSTVCNTFVTLQRVRYTMVYSRHCLPLEKHTYPIELSVVKNCIKRACGSIAALGSGVSALSKLTDQVDKISSSCELRFESPCLTYRPIVHRPLITTQSIPFESK